MHKGILLLVVFVMALGAHASQKDTLSRKIGMAAERLDETMDWYIKEHIGGILHSEPDDLEQVVPQLKKLAESAQLAHMVMLGVREASAAMIRHNSTGDMAEVGVDAFMSATLKAVENSPNRLF